LPDESNTRETGRMSTLDASMRGKTCLVTGATAGIGEVTARELARRGASVVLVSRSADRCTATVTAIQRETGNPSVTFLQADLSSQAEVRNVAQELLNRHAHLHVLINNAGALFAPRRESVDGIEMTLALNHLGYFLLTNLLLERIKASAPARIVNVSSDAHQWVKRFNFDDPQAKVTYPAFGSYARSKLANLLFSYELARRLEGTGVTVNALHPGFVASNFTAGNGAIGWVFRRFAEVFAISTEEGAKTSIYLATSPEVEGVSGGYYVKQKAILSSPASRDEQAARRLWDLSEKLSGMSASV
jgi:retinol dehydrogenase 12